MGVQEVLDPVRMGKTGGYKVDVSRGERIGRVSSEWFSRPADERYLSLNELMDSVRGRAERSRTRVVESALIHVEASRTDAEHLSLILPGSDTPVAPTHWSFGQLASQIAFGLVAILFYPIINQLLVNGIVLVHGRFLCNLKK